MRQTGKTKQGQSKTTALFRFGGEAGKEKREKKGREGKQFKES
jgi:hypothetical protein